MGGTHVNWYPVATGQQITASQICEMGTRIQIGGFGKSGTYELYVLATRPVKLVFWQGGYNCSPEIVSVYGNADLYFASNEQVGHTVITPYSNPVYHSPGDVERVWIYAGIDGHYTNITYRFYWYHCEGGGSYYHGVGGTTPDFNGRYLDYSPHPTVSGEDTGHHDPNVERYVDDNDWNWASVNGYTLQDGNLISPEPITVEPEPEPTTEFSVNVTITCVPESTGGNPYEPGGDAEPGGGGGTYDNVSDVIPRPPLPDIGIADGTFIAMFNPTQSELRELANALFDTSIWTEAYRKIFGNPIDYIVSLTIAPLQPPVTSEPVEFSLGPSPFANISMYQITQQYVEVNCGTITIPEYWKAFLDYEPYSAIQIFLPYIGYRDLNPSEVLNKPLNVRYYVDLLMGTCVAFVETDGTILYQFDGNCLAELPINGQQRSQLVSGAASAIGLGLTALATKGLGMFGKAGDFMLWGSAASAASSVINSAKPSVVHGGNLTANQGLLGIQKPYCILRRPRQAIASEQNAFAGYATWFRSPNFLFTQGFTKVAEIHLENVPATEWEIREIERLLKEGVIF